MRPRGRTSQGVQRATRGILFNVYNSVPTVSPTARGMAYVDCDLWPLLQADPLRTEPVECRIHVWAASNMTIATTGVNNSGRWQPPRDKRYLKWCFSGEQLVTTTTIQSPRQRQPTSIISINLQLQHLVLAAQRGIFVLAKADRRCLRRACSSLCRFLRSAPLCHGIDVLLLILLALRFRQDCYYIFFIIVHHCQV